jgi:SAM-dependent methyltransferase
LTILNHGHARNAALSLIAADGKALPFGDATWDGVLAECSLSLAEDAPTVLNECRRVLRHLGWLVLSDVYLRDPAAGVQVRALPSCCCLAGALTHEELLEAITACGFQSVHWEDHSPALKAFAAQLIFFHDSSIEQFWMRAAQDKREAVALPELKKVIAQARPGYFLLIARKSAEY